MLFPVAPSLEILFFFVPLLPPPSPPGQLSHAVLGSQPALSPEPCLSVMQSSLPFLKF